MVWDKKYECMEKEELEKVQLNRLKETVRLAYERIPFYRKALCDNGLSPDDITSLDRLLDLPLTTKEDLRQYYPYGMLAVQLSEIVEIHASSGTTGTPTVVAYTRGDIDLWSEVMARTIACTGATSEDIVQNAYGYGLFTGGLGFHYGALRLGATVVPMSSGGTKRQIRLMRDFGSTVLTCTPSYALYMAEIAADMGIDPSKSTLRIGIFGAEPWTHGMRVQIEKVWGLIACDIYGLSEIIGPGVAVECPAKDGLHLWADHFLPEIIDPETGERVSEGQDGELVLTTLTKRAMPLIRYRTGDITNITFEPCKGCGRTAPRISKIKGRTDDMLIIRGVNVFPSQIESVLMEIAEVEPYYQLLVSRARGLDELEVCVEVKERFFSDQIGRLEVLREKIQTEIESVLGLTAKVRLVEPKTIQRSEGKAKRVIDKRAL
ncbi:MAG TPA: phenylacetate--CoA ligase family protein [Candidatus Latescibacteria bacterium]|nr:phenylacetate--CoA ligase family protein [Candidatus Latescibacterota bacterium]